jgi:hypothetical protein
MSFYQEIKTAKAAAIGTVMPWTGGISDIPDGWIVCDGSAVSAKKFPLLARAIGDTYNLSTAVTEGLIDTFSFNAPVVASRIPDTYTYSPQDGSGAGSTFAIIVGDAGTQGGGSPNGEGGTVSIVLLTAGINYQAGDVLTVPSGNSGGGGDITITVDTVRQGSVSTFGGEFPNYTGEIILPAILNKPLVDMEVDYLGPASPTGRAFDLDSTAVAEVTPYIGTNTDTGVPTSFNDVATDVVFELNERTTQPIDGGGISYYYSGKLQGNTIIQGSGEGNKIMYFGPRKLGRGHIKGHDHGGRIDSIKKDPVTTVGKGVIPWSNIVYTFTADYTEDGNVFITNDNEWFAQAVMSDYERGRSGFGGGREGRTIAGIIAENPPINWTPQSVAWSPVKDVLTQPATHRTFNEAVGVGGLVKGALSGGISGFNKGQSEFRAVDYKVGGGQINTIPVGYTNWYPELLEYANPNDPRSIMADPSQFVVYDTFNSNPGWDFNRTQNTAGARDQILSHTHDEFDVNFIVTAMRPENSINVYVTAPADKLNLDNQRNVGVFQINFNTTQPGMTSVYVIRAY